MTVKSSHFYIAGAKNNSHGFILHANSSTGAMYSSRIFGSEGGVTLAMDVKYGTISDDSNDVLYLVGFSNVDLSNLNFESPSTERIWISRLNKIDLSDEWGEIKMYGSLRKVATWAGAVEIRRDGSAVVIGATESIEGQDVSCGTIQSCMDIPLSVGKSVSVSADLIWNNPLTVPSSVDGFLWQLAEDP